MKAIGHLFKMSENKSTEENKDETLSVFNIPKDKIFSILTIGIFLLPCLFSINQLFRHSRCYRNWFNGKGKCRWCFR